MLKFTPSVFDICVGEFSQVCERRKVIQGFQKKKCRQRFFFDGKYLSEKCKLLLKYCKIGGDFEGCFSHI